MADRNNEAAPLRQESNETNPHDLAKNIFDPHICHN